MSGTFLLDFPLVGPIKVNLLNGTEIFQFIDKGSTLDKSKWPTISIWMKDSLLEHAGENWKEGNQGSICKSLITKFTETYGEYWNCQASYRNNRIYSQLHLDVQIGYIRFDFDNGLSFFITKVPGK